MDDLDERTEAMRGTLIMLEKRRDVLYQQGRYSESAAFAEVHLWLLNEFDNACEELHRRMIESIRDAPGQIPIADEMEGRFHD